jgi:hypothetical protein
MPRYVTQDLFDAMAIARAMLGTTPTPELEKILADTVDSYRRSYPDEDFDRLRVDLSSASNEVERIANEIRNTLFEPDDENREGVYFAVLKELNAIVMSQSKKKQPFFKRIFGGTFFHYEKTQPTNRVVKCKENVSLAGILILAKQIGALNRMCSHYLYLCRDFAGR